MGLRLLPDSFDNQQRGHPVALWLFYLATIVTVGRSLAHIFLADGGAQSIATVPLEQFTPEGAASVVSMFAFWGLSQLLLAFIMVLVSVNSARIRGAHCHRHDQAAGPERHSSRCNRQPGLHPDSDVGPGSIHADS